MVFWRNISLFSIGSIGAIEADCTGRSVTWTVLGNGY